MAKINFINFLIYLVLLCQVYRQKSTMMDQKVVREFSWLTHSLCSKKIVGHIYNTYEDGCDGNQASRRISLEPFSIKYIKSKKS
jgi:hypothetical protein